ncbi:DNA-binding protein [Thermus scotoductus]|uniref:DNA-binding protein n=1 Tax=Thermus scotoductus TaxID=37636 RepID=A0A430SB13_THESC|nr:helix-turn-helix domain-containing protein [Thermus scotoductus]RTG95893.1 DNA-binding protein [Thermus scotoductus]RTH11215.1 DNA-binding protein [Thermus scotoductus]RTH13596.1 DNA-binding protein [Thermus scotoductus]RTH14226.1 DNA-binding protein [Thermus scotoductus]RTH17934.1 DNA-binding protein [Thermus scotoductus]
MRKLGLSVKEAASALGVHPNHIYRLVWRGELRAARLGARLIIPRKEIERLLGVPVDLEEDAPEAPRGR